MNAPRRIAEIFGIVLLSVLLLELLLQAGALAVRATGRARPAVWLTGNLRVLCLGEISASVMEFSRPTSPWRTDSSTRPGRRRSYAQESLALAPRQGPDTRA